MGRGGFLPVYITVSSVLLALMWKFAPQLGQHLPPHARTNMLLAVSKVMMSSGFIKPRGMTDQERAEKAAEDRSFAEAAARSSRASADLQSSKVYDATKGAPPSSSPVTTGSPSPATAAPPPPLQSEPATTKAPVSAATAKIERTTPDKADWAVLMERSKVGMLKANKSLGTAEGGRFFIITDRRTTRDGKTVFSGNFSPKPLPSPVRIYADNLSCFTGSPEGLSEEKRLALRMYYQIHCEAEAFKTKLLRENAEKSPYFKDTAKALEDYQAMVKRVESRKSTNADSDRKATYELSQLKTKLQELNQKHQEWKEKHADELLYPDRHPKYLNMLQERLKYAEVLGDLVD